MRKIKFRAWHPTSGMTITPILTRNDFTGMARCEGYNSDGQMFHLELMQFTGLTDKNGVEIYEGDILSNCIDPVLIKWTVCHNGYCFCIKNHEMDRIHPIDDSSFFIDRDIIGNIHQNPELLEQQ